MISAVFTKWGWVSARAMYRFQEAHKQAVAGNQHLFLLDGSHWDTRFIGYLLQHLENEGLVPEKTDIAVPLFEQEQGHA
jgi:hypothetical protein